MALVDYILLFNAGIYALFALPHIFSEDGNIAAMGWDVPSFMPLKGKAHLPVPSELSLLLSHLCAILGTGQLSLVLMCLMAAGSSSKEVKKVAL